MTTTDTVEAARHTDLIEGLARIENMLERINSHILDYREQKRDAHLISAKTRQLYAADTAYLRLHEAMAHFPPGCTTIEISLSLAEVQALVLVLERFAGVLR